jgi:PilZN1 domain-containing protein/PilZ domain-containing protein
VSNTTCRYGNFFPPGQRVQVGIPLTSGSTFAEWGTLYSLEDDLITVQLSRDQLPERAQLHLGSVLELKVSRDGTFFGCQALLVEEYEGMALALRLLGEMNVDDLREYYRIDVFLPFKYSVPPGQIPAEVKSAWEAMQDQRAQRQNHQARFLPFRQDAPPLEEHDQAWQKLPPVAANISGGGLKVMLTDRLAKGTLVHIELFLPTSPPRVIDIVGRVVFATPFDECSINNRLFNTALTFHFIAERDRDAIVAFVSAQQLARLQTIQVSVEAPAGREPDLRPGRRQILRWTIGAVIGLMALYLFARGLAGYYAGHEKHEIETIFERGLQKYLEQFK